MYLLYHISVHFNNVDFKSKMVHLIKRLNGVCRCTVGFAKLKWRANSALLGHILKGKSTLNTISHDQILSFTYDDVPRPIQPNVLFLLEYWVESSNILSKLQYLPIPYCYTKFWNFEEKFVPGWVLRPGSDDYPLYFKN